MMTQDFTAKCETIVSLLQCVYAHLDYVPGALHVQRYGDSEEGAPTGPAPCTVVTRRWTCWQTWPQYRLIVQLPPRMTEEKWAAEYASLRKRYRIGDVEESLTRLSRVEPTLAQAVWAEYVEPWLDPKTEPVAPEMKEQRRVWAEAGIEWLAHDIRGEVEGFGEPLQSQRPPVTARDRLIVEMRIGGASYGEIVKKARCSRSTVKAVLSGLKVRRGRTMSAVSTVGS